jgi:hypothetical protein
MDRIIQLCEEIERGYQNDKAGLDPGMVDRVLEISSHAAVVGRALIELRAARELLGGLASESQFDFSHTEVESLRALKVRCRCYIRLYAPEHARHLTGQD